MGCAASAAGTAGEEDLLKPGFSEKYELGDLIGSGAFARVYKVQTIRKPRRTRVVKVMEDSGWSTEDWSTRNIYMRESSILQSLRHAHVVRFFDFFAENNFLYMVLEHLSGGEVFKHLVSRGRLEEDETRHLVHQMASAIAYLHANSIIYRDVKADNFVFTDERRRSVKLVDYGLAVRVTPRDLPLSEICGSPHSLSPELIGQSYSFPVDLWALGILVHLLLHGQYPFQAPSTQELVVFVLNSKISDQIADHISPQGKAFIEALCEPDEQRRLTAKGVLQHPWLRSGGRKFLRKTATDPAALQMQQTLPAIHRQYSIS